MSTHMQSGGSKSTHSLVSPFPAACKGLQSMCKASASHGLPLTILLLHAYKLAVHSNLHVTLAGPGLYIVSDGPWRSCAESCASFGFHLMFAPVHVLQANLCSHSGPAGTRGNAFQSARTHLVLSAICCTLRQTPCSSSEQSQCSSACVAACVHVIVSEAWPNQQQFQGIARYGSQPAPLARQVWWRAQGKRASKGGCVWTHRAVQGRSQVCPISRKPWLLPYICAAATVSTSQGDSLLSVVMLNRPVDRLILEMLHH